VPIGIIALAIVLRFLHIPRQARGKARIDWWGAAMVIVALVPLLLVAEQGRDWGWDSPIAIGCYVIGAIGIVAFIIIETVMKDDAIIPLKLFRSSTFSMATIIGVFVGFGMFGAMLTLPLYLQLVLGSTPTESGFQLLPMILGLMIASIVSGQIIARTGRYRIFPMIGTAFMAVGFFTLTRLVVGSSYWLIALAMLLIGLGLGQLMQTLTIASQNSVGPRDMGVATSASTFFRQIGGTLGTAVLLSLMFAVMPANVQTSFADEETLSSALDAALDPEIANAPENQAIMATIYTPMVTQLTTATTEQIQTGLQQASDAATKAVADQVAAGTIPAAAQDAATKVAVAAAQAKAAAQIEQQIPVAQISADGTVTLDFSDDAARQAYVDQVAPTVAEKLSGSGDESSIDSSSLDDTSFLNGANAALTKPILVAFNASAVLVYWVAMFVVLIAFVLTIFFRTPPLRDRSALQEAADEGLLATAAAEEVGALVSPGVATGSIDTDAARRG
jgi:hypothetical protein